MSNATRLLEQAVSMWTLGPLRSKYQLTRLEMSDDAEPVAAVLSALSGSRDTILDQSSVKDAENTDVREPLSWETASVSKTALPVRFKKFAVSPFSKARYEVSSVHRCIGSRATTGVESARRFPLVYEL